MFAAGRRLRSVEGLDEPALRRRTGPHGRHGHERRPPAAPAGQRRRAVRPRARRRARRTMASASATTSSAAWPRRAPGPRLPAKWLGPVAKDLAAEPRSGARRGRLTPAGEPACARARHERRPRRRPARRSVMPPSPIPTSSTAVTDLKALTDAIAANQVEALVILGGNPVYDAPADLGFADKLVEGALQRARVPLRRRDEREVHVARPARPRVRVVGRRARARRERQRTAAPHRAALRRARATSSCSRCIANAPGEDGARGRPRDGSRRVSCASTASPAAAPSSTGKADCRDKAGNAVPVRASSSSASGTARWPWASRRARPLRLPPPPHPLPPTSPRRSARSLSRLPRARARSKSRLRPARRWSTGAHANNTWLQEMPDPVTKLVWDNAAIVSPATAKALGIESKDVDQDRRRRQVDHRGAYGSCLARPTTRSL